MKRKKREIKQFDPFENLVLDDYEKEIEASLERDEWVPVKNQSEVKKMWQRSAKRALDLRKSKKITVRVNQGDLIRLKAKAQRSNIPYQTLLGVLIRDFVKGDYSVKL